MATQPIEVTRDGAVATITLCRPEVLNATNAEMADELSRAVRECSGDPGVRVMVLTGAGKGFCAGGDMKAAWEAVTTGQDPRPFFAAVTASLHRAVLDLRRAPQPVIAAINGAAGGIGISLAAACDLRVAAATAKFKTAYTTVGLVPDGGWTATVARLIGLARATELLILDPVIDAERALALGLVHEVVPAEELMARVGELAGRLARSAAGAVAAAKALLNASLLADLEAQLERERAAIVERCATAEFRERLGAFVAAQARPGRS
jgi:2-(1,2-epoxy-1,2-dihydrophenyl)acetyl-CoA isomerase